MNGWIFTNERFEVYFDEHSTFGYEVAEVGQFLKIRQPKLFNPENYAFTFAPRAYIALEHANNNGGVVRVRPHSERIVLDSEDEVLFTDEIEIVSRGHVSDLVNLWAVDITLRALSNYYFYYHDQIHLDPYLFEALNRYRKYLTEGFDEEMFIKIMQDRQKLDRLAEEAEDVARKTARLDNDIIVADLHVNVLKAAHYAIHRGMESLVMSQVIQYFCWNHCLRIGQTDVQSYNRIWDKISTRLNGDLEERLFDFLEF